MARAGYCDQCGANVWLKDDGGCVNGHDASHISNVYEAEAAPPAPDTSAQVDKTVDEIGQGLNEAGQQIGDFAKQAWAWGKKQAATDQQTGGDVTPPSDPQQGGDR